MHTRGPWAWAFYDWANSAFATVVMAGFFPIFFREYWSAGHEESTITFWLGVGNALSSIAVVLLAPLLGALADRASWRKRFLILFAGLGIGMTAGLFWLAKGQQELAITFYALAALGFMGSNVFYDSLLVSVSKEAHYDRWSATGYALGYLGGGLLFTVCVLMTLNPDWFGLDDAAAGVKWSFLLTAVWWAVFSLPLIFWVDENKASDNAKQGLVAASFSELATTVKAMGKLPMTWLFLVAYWLYIDGVDSIVRMAVDYGKALGFESSDLITALLITQFVGFPAAYAFGRFGEWWGAKKAILIAIAAYSLITLWSVFIQAIWEFYAIAVAIGLVQGGVQALSRSAYARLIPPGKNAEFFGFYNMLGKFAAIFGPLMIGVISALSGNHRVAMLSLLILFIGGAILLWKVDFAKGQQQAENF